MWTHCFLFVFHLLHLNGCCRWTHWKSQFKHPADGLLRIQKSWFWMRQNINQFSCKHESLSTFNIAKSKTTSFDRLWSRWCPPSIQQATAAKSLYCTKPAMPAGFRPLSAKRSRNISGRKKLIFPSSRNILICVSIILCFIRNQTEKNKHKNKSTSYFSYLKIKTHSYQANCAAMEKQH